MSLRYFKNKFFTFIYVRQRVCSCRSVCVEGSPLQKGQTQSRTLKVNMYLLDQQALAMWEEALTSLASGALANGNACEHGAAGGDRRMRILTAHQPLRGLKDCSQHLR